MRLTQQLLTAAAIFIAAPSYAQIVPAEKLKSVEQDISLSEARKIEIAKEIALTVAADEKISAQLIALAQDISHQQEAIAQVQVKLEALKKEDIIIRSEFEAKREVLSELLAGLQLLEQNPPPALVVNPNDILGALRSAMVFGAVVPELKDEAVKLTNQLQRLKDLKLELSIAQETAENQINLLNKTEFELARLRLEKQTLLENSKLALAQEDITLKEMTGKAKSLRELMAALETAKVMELNRRDLEAEEAKRQAALLAKPTMRLADAKGRLNYPLQGEIIRKYGDENGLGSNMSGLAIAGATDSIVVSPIDAIVKFAGPFRSLHELVILETADSMQVLLGGFDHIDVRIGQTIRAGEPLGRLGRKSNVTAFMDTTLGGARPLLYVEFIKNGEPIDSTAWWIGAVKEAKSK